MQSGAIRPIPNMLPRQLFNEEHEAFRETVRKFYEKEVVPNIEKYEKQQHVDRDLWNKAGELGLLCTTMPEEYGGSGVDRLYSMILIEEQAYAMDSSTGFLYIPILLLITLIILVMKSKNKNGYPKWQLEKLLLLLQ